MTDQAVGADDLSRLLARAETALSLNEFAYASLVYGQLAALDPANFFYFARYVEAANRLGDTAPARLILGRSGLPADDEQFFWCCQALIEARDFAAARALIERETERGSISSAYLAIGQARLLATIGLRSRAIAALAPILARDDAPPLATQVGIMLDREVGDLDHVLTAGERAAFRHGRAYDARLTAEAMLLLAEADRAAAFLSVFREAHPDAAAELDGLAGDADVQARLWTVARAAHGEPDYADRARLRRALTANADADMILWGKRSLVALLRSDALTADDFDVFGAYLPNWENGEIKNYVLFQALRQRADDARIGERWLRRLIADRCFGDAALWLEGALRRGPSDDMVAFATLLLRLRQRGLLATDEAAGVVGALEPALLAALPGSGWAVRAVLFEHLRALGIDSESWFPSGDPPVDHPGFRRLLAVSTGRMDLAAAPRAKPTLAPRPIVVVSGQVRGFAAAWPALHRHVVAPIGAPVVMTVWDRTTNAIGRHAGRLERLLPDDVVAALRPEQRFTDVFASVFPRTASLIFGEWEETVEELAAVMAATGIEPVALETESDSMLMRLLRPQVTNGMMRMYYKFARAERLVREHEIRTGIAFSHVIWSRPDWEITRLGAASLARCLAHHDVAFSSWTTEVSVGDYFMVLPRLAFAAIAGVFPRVVIGGDSVIHPWLPQRETPVPEAQLLSAFGGPETIFETLLASGIVPLGRVDAIDGRLLGRTPPEAVVRETFLAEKARAGD